MAEFNQALADIYKVIHPINAKNVFVTYLNQIEKPFLEKSDLLTLKFCVKKLKKLLDWKKQQILGLVSKANQSRISTFIDEIKKDTRTMMIVKKAICSEIIKKIKAGFSEEELKINPVYGKYNQYLQKLNWIFQQENKVIEHIVQSLKKGKGFAEKSRILEKLQPDLLSRISDKELNIYVETILISWSKYYQFMRERAVRAAATETGETAEETVLTGNGTEENILPEREEEALLLVNSRENVFMPEDEEAALLAGSEHGMLNLPGFGEEDDAFIEKLAEMDNVNQIVEEINALPEEKQEKVITEISFDPRFDSVYEEIISLKGDMGYFLGSLMKKVKEIEQKYGYTASEDFLNDLIARIKSRKGADHLLVKKIQNCLNNLLAIHERSTKKLGTLKTQLAGKSILEQVKVLQDMAKNKAYKGIFGTVRNLERIALESHFDEIFNNLPVELQKVLAEGFMADLKELKAYYPDLLRKLETKVRYIDNLTSVSYTESNEVDYDFIDNLLSSLPGENADSLGDLSRIVTGIQGNAGEEADYRNLGVIMAGDKEHTPADMLHSLEQQNTNDNSRIDQIIEIISDLEKLPSLNEKISTIRFWLDRKFYNEQPEIEIFLQGQLEALEQKKIREGGLLRTIFDELKNLKGYEAKIQFLETRLSDPEYVHLKSTILNLINNIRGDFGIPPNSDPEQFVLGELEKIPELEDKADWLKIRQAHPDFAADGEFIKQTIADIENREAAAIEEKLEEDLTLDQAREKTGNRKKQGEKPVIHENIITLTRAALKLNNKLERRKMILEQEGLLPLEDENMFRKQRRLLFYLLNIEVGEKPAAMVKSLAEKMLLSREEKVEYFKLLKLARFKSGDKILTLQEELGISDDDMAFYAADILAWNKQSPERKLEYFEKMRDGKIRLDELTFTDKNGEQVRKKYLDFFGIRHQVINRLIVYYQQKAAASKKARKLMEESEIAADIPVEAVASPVDVIIEEREEAIETVSAGSPEIIPELADELPGLVDENEEKIEEETGEESEVLPEEAGEELEIISHSDEDNAEEDFPAELAPEPVVRMTERKMASEKAEVKKEEEPAAEAEITEENMGYTEYPDERGGERAAFDAMQPDTEGYDHYMKNKIKIDEFVKHQLEEKAREKYKEAEAEVKTEMEKAEKEYKRNTGGKLLSIIRNLNACQPEIIAELINHTIIPLLTESGDTATMDLITVLNQNLFSPTLYTGANIDLKTVIANIESFLHVDGIFKDCFNDLVEITEKLKTVRGKYINTAVEKEMHQIAALSTAVKSGDINSILRNLLKVEPPLQIIRELEERYMEPLKDNPGQNSVYSRLQFIKDLIATTQNIDWGKGGALGENTKQMLLQLRENYQSAVQSAAPAAPVQTGKTAGKTSSDPVEKELINAPIFTNPLLLIKNVLKEHKRQMTNEAQQELVNRLAGEGRIFSYDKKLYIGYGKLYGYLNDKNNIGYSKNRLAGELIKFLGRFGEKQDKAAFIGVHGDQFDDFFKKLEYWASHSDAATAEHKTQNPKKAAMQLKKMHAATAGEKKEPKRGRTPAINKRREEKARKKPAAKKSVANKELLMKLNKMITDKLLFLIKESGSRDMLNMLYQSYLDPRAKKSNLFVLVDRDKYQRLYDSIKEDKALHDRLSFDVDTVKRAYKKKMSKVK